MNRRSNRRERRDMRNEWRDTEASTLRVYARLAGANIPDRHWDSWLSMTHLPLTYKRRASLELMVELAVLGYRQWLNSSPLQWESEIVLRRHLEGLRAEKHS